MCLCVCVSGVVLLRCAACEALPSVVFCCGSQELPSRVSSPPCPTPAPIWGVNSMLARNLRTHHQPQTAGLRGVTPRPLSPPPLSLVRMVCVLFVCACACASGKDIFLCTVGRGQVESLARRPLPSSPSSLQRRPPPAPPHPRACASPTLTPCCTCVIYLQLLSDFCLVCISRSVRRDDGCPCFVVCCVCPVQLWAGRKNRGDN